MVNTFWPDILTSNDPKIAVFIINRLNPRPLNAMRDPKSTNSISSGTADEGHATRG